MHALALHMLSRCGTRVARLGTRETLVSAPCPGTWRLCLLPAATCGRPWGLMVVAETLGGEKGT